MKRVFICIALLAIVATVIYTFFEYNYNFEKIGNTKYKIMDLENYISKIGSYSAIANIKITSNKTKNTYKVKQEEIKGEYFYQEVIEPYAIAGSKFKYEKNNLCIENTKLNINKIYENYQYISSNQLSLICFLNDYNNLQERNLFEDDKELVMEVSIKNENKYIAKKTLKIDKNTCLPYSLEIRDNTQNVLVYILYNEIEINKTQEQI